MIMRITFLYIHFTLVCVRIFVPSEPWRQNGVNTKAKIRDVCIEFTTHVSSFILLFVIVTVVLRGHSIQDKPVFSRVQLSPLYNLAQSARQHRCSRWFPDQLVDSCPFVVKLCQIGGIRQRSIFLFRWWATHTTSRCCQRTIMVNFFRENAWRAKATTPFTLLLLVLRW